MRARRRAGQGRGDVRESRCPLKPDPDGSSSPLADRAAMALDATHLSGRLGPRAIRARERLAAWLDGAEWMSDADVERACVRLEDVARAGRILREAVGA